MIFAYFFSQNFKNTVKVTWLAETGQAPFTPAVMIHYDYLISKGILGKDEDFKQFVNQKSKVSDRFLDWPYMCWWVHMYVCVCVYVN